MYAGRLKDNYKGNAGGNLSRSGANSVIKPQYKGCRAKGGGRKDRCLELKQHVKAWCEVERSYGHTLSLLDLYLEFKHVAMQEIQRLTNALADCMEVEAVVAGTIIQGTSGMKSRLVELKSRLAKLEASQTYCKTFRKRLQITCGLKLRKAQRLVDISPKEEHARCQLTWQAYDQILHLAAFGSVEQLGGCIVCPARFIEDRESIILGFTDQVPFWVKVGQEKQLYCDHEVAKNTKDGRQGPSKRAAGQGSQAAAGDIEDCTAEDGMTQLRSHHQATGDRYRVTVELCQLVTGHF